MRLILELTDPKQSHQIVHFLALRGIEARVEVVLNTDWGSDQYGDSLYQVWVEDEDDIEESKEWVEKIQDDPALLSEATKFVSMSEETPKVMPQPAPKQSKKQSQAGNITLFFLVFCSFIFLADTFYYGISDEKPEKISDTIIGSPIRKSLLFDYPSIFDRIDKEAADFPSLEGKSEAQMNEQQQILLRILDGSPFWKGYSSYVTATPVQREKQNQAKTFERIRQGEVYRLFTPCLLHSNFIHLFFNMMWLLILGSQIEKRLSFSKYLFLIVLTSTLSNLAQYMMSGFHFLGFSGVIAGMFTFIYMRKRLAPWEGYRLDRQTLIFILLFFIATTGLEISLLFLQWAQNIELSTRIANTAHIAGAVIGAILGALPSFSWKQH